MAALACLLSIGQAGAQAGESYAVPSHESYDELLSRYVNSTGVNYAAWADDADDVKALDDYLVTLSQARPSEWDRDEALAYWINVYNAVTLQLILKNYPVESIKDLGGFLSSPWKRKLFTVEGEELTLNEIENEVIRPTFQEPRIHFAVNCASVSCPPLRAEAFVAVELDRQLEEQTKAFLTNPVENRWESNDELVLSKIFDWYGEDFRSEDSTVVDYVKRYLPNPDADPKVSVKHGDYDWNLNEAKADS